VSQRFPAAEKPILSLAWRTVDHECQPKDDQEILIVTLVNSAVNNFPRALPDLLRKKAYFPK